MLYAIEGKALIEQKVMAFSALNICERSGLQPLIRAHPDALGEDLLIIAEEFCSWEDSRRRVDLLALDRDARLVVIELKRTDDGGHMELQALRYAAMVSAMTFDEVVAAYSESRAGDAGSTAIDPRAEVASFIGRSEDEGAIEIATDVRIILVSADFGREITTTVLWLNNFDGMDIRCVRLAPYRLDGRVYVDIQQVIPLPEAQDYQVKLRRKEVARERSKNASEGRDMTHYHIIVHGTESEALGKRHAALRMVTELSRAGVPYEQMAPLLFPGALRNVPGLISESDALLSALQSDHPIADPRRRYFVEHPLPDPEGNRTWVLSTQWRADTADILRRLSMEFPDKGVTLRVADERAD